MRVLVNISYHGGGYLGFQIQNEGRTIQQQFEKILKRMHKRHVRIHPSSRTDRGVHAIEQYFHFDTPLNISEEKWQYAMNSALPHDIHVNDVTIISDDFHCRYDCVGKMYRYRTYHQDHINPFQYGLKTFVKEDLDLKAMQEAAKHFIGTHDFTGFCSQKTEVVSKERTIYRSEIIETEEGFDYVIAGSGFLYNMVRVIVAFLIEVGKGKRHPNDVNRLLELKDRNAVPHTAPPEGLYLEKIYLSDEALIQDYGEDIEIHYKKSTQNN
ncbi:tRNA pseudouridine(38-40) synthase TruA [Staphylococcus massiliensis]|uniref:tRNA pseudouridine synthase A n=1 Tax=Staphylococcus massiliensis S46 TaxID=1229783 RepID=K9ANQ1_9STAP|nr:tRNA pseudouridine(38-40) synthase TruA [Staphylococcus massiliensis]EKU48899.1 tRNA pseudouridine synthase A [Staphylococcus massiliensis S46]MCG3399339.1 tRNA pseudouridine(38-40) synthase TruA [Staphylococcus massiliensis]MCG3402560.1 tRNA pseudouridine(38-40) synthase TruA [Staphylococcus massiliensis]MCG3413343.1 tRNA pseudouridine(38-40) synthase TruA [Staphylococcus massiliensis]PNZ98818.1 tRNA pseudouridine(38-40) synthase TruA [Staphylococcus massiliensis CCUG 55927]